MNDKDNQIIKDYKSMIRELEKTQRLTSERKIQYLYTLIMERYNDINKYLIKHEIWQSKLRELKEEI